METLKQSPITVTKRGYSLEETGEVLGVSKGFINLEIRRGKLRARRFGRRVIILAEDLEQYISARQTLKAHPAKSRNTPPAHQSAAPSSAA
jgi:excisionase family DNA binding protein